MKTYNKHMRGMDLGELLITLYQTPLKAKQYFLWTFAL